MERDIIDRLRDFDLDHRWHLRSDAADEIERLRGEIESWKALVQDLERRLKD